VSAGDKETIAANRDELDRGMESTPLLVCAQLCECRSHRQGADVSVVADLQGMDYAFAGNCELPP
jgi:hypothetical protein